MITIKIKVIPKSRVSLVQKEADDSYRVKVEAPPEKGKANKRVIELLAGYFDVSKSKIQILKGEFSSRKIIGLDILKLNK